MSVVITLGQLKGLWQKVRDGFRVVGSPAGPDAVQVAGKDSAGNVQLVKVNPDGTVIVSNNMEYYWVDTPPTSGIPLGAMGQNVLTKVIYQWNGSTWGVF